MSWDSNMTIDGFSNRQAVPFWKLLYFHLKETSIPSPIRERFFSQCLRALAPVAVSSLVCILMASSSLAPSPQTTIMPLQPKRKLCSSTLPPLQLLLSLLLPQTSYTNAHASSLSFSSAPIGIWLGSLPPSPKPWPRPSHPT